MIHKTRVYYTPFTVYLITLLEPGKYAVFLFPRHLASSPLKVTASAPLSTQDTKKYIKSLKEEASDQGMFFSFLGSYLGLAGTITLSSHFLVLLSPVGTLLAPSNFDSQEEASPQKQSLDEAFSYTLGAGCEGTILDDPGLAFVGTRPVYKVKPTLLSLDGLADFDTEEPDVSCLLSFLSVGDFLLSPFYDLSQTYQFQYNGARRKRSYFIWNSFLKASAPSALHAVVPDLFLGYANTSFFNVGNKRCMLTLLCRRTNRFAGVRYRRRGINQEGFVANEVESELVFHTLGQPEGRSSAGRSGQAEESLEDLLSGLYYSSYSLQFYEYFLHRLLRLSAAFSSPERASEGPGERVFDSVGAYVIHRGSVPLFWSQPNSNSAHPEIVVSRVNEGVAAKHLRRLERDYGGPVLGLTLLRSHDADSSEVRLHKAYFDLAAQEKVKGLLQLKELDFLYMEKQGLNTRLLVEKLTERERRNIGVFFWQAESSQEARQGREVLSLQRGAIRVNCVDCLDRTNAGQYYLGKLALKECIKLHFVDSFLRESWKKEGPGEEAPGDLFDQLFAEVHVSGAGGKGPAVSSKKEYLERLRQQMEDTRYELPEGALKSIGSLFNEQANAISAQYGGSQALHQNVYSRRSNNEISQKTSSLNKWTNKAFNFISSAKRMLNNTLWDDDKQRGYDLFLGNYKEPPKGDGADSSRGESTVNNIKDWDTADLI